MNTRWWWKFALLGACGLWSIAMIYPTLSRMDVEKSKFPIKQKINLGLDLQGGLYLIMGVDFTKVFVDVTTRLGDNLESRFKEKGISVQSKKIITAQADDPRVRITLDAKSQDAARELIKKEYSQMRLTDDQAGTLELGLTGTYRGDIRDKTIDQSIEVIRNRIDQFGVSEPTIARQGNDRVVVELPGVKDVDRAKELIGRTARLEFRIVNDTQQDVAQLSTLVTQIEKEHGLSSQDKDKFSEYVQQINVRAVGKIPEDSEISFERRKDFDGRTLGWTPYLLYKKVEVSGDELQDAAVSFDQETQRPEVGFSFNPRGSALFGTLTDANIKKRLAIVLDGVVFSAPVIQSKITSRGRITLGTGNAQDLMREAKDLAIVLRAGALPAKLELLEQRVVGPSLGADSIRTGSMSGVIGVVMVLLFVLFYYRVSGAIAVVSLILNVIFVLALLVGFEATLTLPGIAGIALTVGIAVDSNVVIYERIREELRAGKLAASAVEAGFQKAFRTILDANITNAAAACVLMMYGTGPVKGFAVTLLIGIVTTLFTAVFVCRMLFDLYLKRLESRAGAELSI